jgi:hypothetical protein
MMARNFGVPDLSSPRDAFYALLAASLDGAAVWMKVLKACSLGTGSTAARSSRGRQRWNLFGFPIALGADPEC